VSRTATGPARSEALRRTRLQSAFAKGRLTIRSPIQARLHGAAARGMRATVLGILVSVALAGVKVIGGLFGHSYALIADGFESVLDILSALVVWGSLRIAARPPTERFPYGFGKAEPLSAVAIAAVLLIAAAALAVQSVREILTPHHMPEPFTLLILVVVVAAKEAMFRTLARTGEAIGSSAIRTDAWHHRSDALTSLAAFAGISVALLGGPGYESADDWAALLACSLIGWNGVRLFRAAWAELLDVAPAPEVVEGVRGRAGSVPGVRAIEKCHLRKSGLGLFCDIHVVVDAELPVREGHRIAHAVKDALLEGTPGLLDVAVHIEPTGT
jgi:cation diffusion facilitator family transporter